MLFRDCFYCVSGTIKRMNNPLITKYGGEKRWVTYRIIERDGKKTKVPFQTNGKPASSTDPATWVTHAELNGAPAGIVFTESKTLLGIDIDKCLTDNKITHEQKELIADLILEADTYTEISPSGTGLHLFIEIPEGIKINGNRKSPYELYSDGRYFTFTGNIYGNSRDIRICSVEEAGRILAIIGYPFKKEKVVSPQSPALSPVQSIDIDDETVLTRMFQSKGGNKIKELYDGDVSKFNGDDSAADASLCAHLAFFTGKNASQIEKIWLASPLGLRQKTQGRADYRTATVNFAMENCTATYESRAMKFEKENPTLNFLYTLSPRKEKIYIQNTENMCRVLRGHADFKGRFRFDAFKNMVEYRPDNEKWRMLEDNDDVEIQTAISILFPSFFGKVGTLMIHDAIVKVAIENKVDSAKDYITSIVWDKTPRVDDWLHHAYGVEKNAYFIAVGSNWLKGLVKRLVEPGCQFDYVLVLEGEQGIKKSMSLATLGGDWYVETNMGTDSKDFFMQFQGKAIIEFSEGETMNRTEVKKMKAIITTKVDRFRPPYGRNSQDFPRRCVFAMTTNQEEYLKDETGNRRWLPVKVVLPEANIDWIHDNRDQLFAEAYHRVVVNKEKIYEFPKEETLAEQGKREIEDPNSDVVAEWYYKKLTQDDRDQGITLFQVYRDVYCGGFISKQFDKYHEIIISNVVKKKLKLKKRRAMFRGILCVRWFDETNGFKMPVERSAVEESLSGNW